MPFVTTADAVDRETAFLNTTTDGLPVLPSSAGGRWDVIQAYVPRTPAHRKNQIWVTRTGFSMERTANQRTMPTYVFDLQLRWTLSNTAGSGEADQRAFDVAVNDVVMRVLGQPPPAMDKTHNGFLSVAENPRHVQVHYLPVEPSMAAGAYFAASVVYAADDYELND